MGQRVDVKVRAVITDIAGTTVADDGVVMASFVEAFRRVVPGLDSEREAQFIAYAQQTMGQSKREVFTHLLDRADLVDDALAEFEASYLSGLTRLTPIPGVEETCGQLRESGLALGATTGFSRPVLDSLLSQLGWNDMFGATATPDETGVGRPEPSMLFHVASALDVGPGACMVVGDTISDMEAGRHFGAGIIAGVLTGTHDRTQLEQAGATVVIPSFAHLPSLLEE